MVSQRVGRFPRLEATGEPEGRRTSFGSQTQAGSTFVARMLTVVTTLKSQQRNVLEFLIASVVAAREDKQAPCLLPCGSDHSVDSPCPASVRDQEDLLKAA
jgi:hypothetical protein